MTEDADGPKEPTRSDGTDESASDREDDPTETDAATNGAGEGEAESAEGGTDPDEAEADWTEPNSDAGDDEDEANSATDADTTSPATDADEGIDGDGDATDDDALGGDTADGADDGAVDGNDDDGDDEVVVDRRSPYADDGDDVDDTDDADDTAADEGDEGEGPESTDHDTPLSGPVEDVTSGSADDGNPGQESRIEEVEPPDEPVPDATPRDAPPEPPGGFPEEDEELTAAEKGMQTVENVGNALGGGGEGPESDQEMPLTAHIEEMMRRLSAVFLVAAVVSGLVLFVGSVSPAVPSAAELIRYFWDFHVGLPSSPGADDGYSPYVYGPLEYLLTKLKVVGLAGLLAGLPMFVYQTYRFMRPGLYPHERRYYLAAVPTSLVLGIVGAAFAHFAVLPFVFDYFISYTVGTAELAFGLKETFNLILIMMGYFAIVFQIPLFIQLAIMMGVVTREWLEDRRLIFWGAFLGLALTFITVDPTGFAPIIVVATMIVLFEGTLALLRWTGN
ncbi:twin-arginine translocase subunit TatC [Halorarum halophilum]|uniref:Sec-independent protein translocase protein TatC n=1 Tax=Halorarum halophilum TaxID=2743090 RepID=A0A7D5GCE3_9EURY|nr:twin-arginine translocase subunit TatC [Halobaculum halophilum]QLG28145.1 twin-arginine translocase subunit TatC [Halobaculum halophilum]